MRALLRPLVAGAIGALLVTSCSSNGGETSDTGGSGASTSATDTGGSVDPSTPSTGGESDPTVWLRTTTTRDPGAPATTAVPTQARPTGDTPEQEAAAEVLAECALGDKNCYAVEAVQVEWPGAAITEIDLRFADLTGADLRGADLTFSRMSGAILNGANLALARLSGADLTGTDLTGANLAGADLSGADLRGAVMTDAILDGADLTRTLFCTTVMPDGSMNDRDC